jgi:hypothetical protein
LTPEWRRRRAQPLRASERPLLAKGTGQERRKGCGEPCGIDPGAGVRQRRGSQVANRTALLIAVFSAGHAGDEQGWKSDHLEPFSFWGHSCPVNRYSIRRAREIVHKSSTRLFQSADPPGIVVESLQRKRVVCCERSTGNGRRGVKSRHFGNGMREVDSVWKDVIRREYPGHYSHRGLIEFLRLDDWEKECLYSWFSAIRAGWHQTEDRRRPVSETDKSKLTRARVS